LLLISYTKLIGQEHLKSAETVKGKLHVKHLETLFGSHVKQLEAISQALHKEGFVIS
jgi:hypothetical protein